MPRITRRDAVIAVFGGVVADYLVRLLDRAVPRFMALVTVVVSSVFAVIAGLDPLRVGLIALALFLLAHFLVLVVSFVGGARVPNAHTANPNLPQRIFVQMAITAVALFVLPLEDVVRAVQRVR
jgi:hypothetical protein